MNKARLVIAAGLVILFSLVIGMVDYGRCDSLQIINSRIRVQVVDGKKQISIEPATIKLVKGGVVIWFNAAPTEEIRVIFEEGKRCQELTSPSRHFNLEASCYVASWVGSNETTVLKFNESGTFKYTVQTPDGVEAQGEVVVSP
ncbi:MAG: hypothetical protein JXD19_02320 [Deltaproteobacteria bacterium]|nr:hypothetical protein [Deltaproteobacteria bacterium]